MICCFKICQMTNTRPTFNGNTPLYGEREQVDSPAGVGRRQLLARLGQAWQAQQKRKRTLAADLWCIPICR